MDLPTLELFIAAFALAALFSAFALGPARLPARASRLLARLSRRDSGPLYQI